jgi:hypothetical protein
MNKNDIEKELREEWFKDHKAKLEKLSDDISILTWKAPGTNSYYVRYVFDYNKVYITGDLGDAIFKIYDKVDLEKAASFDNYYFHQKLTARDEEKWAFSEEKAIERLKEEIAQIEENKSEYLGLDEDGTGIREGLSDEEAERVDIYDEQIEMFNNMIDSAGECNCRSNWVCCIYENYIDNLSDYDPDVYEWIFDIGNDYPRSVQAFLIGLKIAYEQLREKEILQD